MNRPSKAPAERKKSNVWEITAGREKGRWRWEIEYTRADGTTHRKAGSRGDKADALKARDTAINEYNKTEGRNSQGHTVKSWCEHCLDEIFPNDLRGTTIDAYRHWLRTRVYPLLGNMRLEALTTPTLQVFLNRLQDDDVDSAANRTKTALAACLTRAVENGLLPINPIRQTKLRNASLHEVQDDEADDVPAKRILTAKEIDALLDRAKGTMMYLPIALGAKLGMRLGECLGLPWKNVNLADRTVRVRQQVQRVVGKGIVVTPPKTPAGNRTLFIPASLLPILEEALAISDGEGQPWVCHHSEGGLMTTQLATPKFKKIAEEARVNGKKGLPDATHHDLRSTLLSWLANQANGGIGVRPATLKRIAGHSKLEVTMRYYVRATEEDVATAMSYIP